MVEELEDSWGETMEEEDGVEDLGVEAMEEVDMEEGEDMKTNVSKCWNGILK